MSTSTTAPRSLVVIPTYNERDCVTPITQAVLDAAPGAHVLIVDDNSPDGTGAIADALAAANPRVRVLHREGKQGLGAAYRHAFGIALEQGWSAIVQMDADFSHDPHDVPRMLAAIHAGADLAIGSRYTRGGGTRNWGLGRRLISRFGCLYAQVILGVRVRDLTSGFKAWSADGLRRLRLGEVTTRGYGFQIEMNYRALRNGLRVTEVPILFVERRAGASKMSGQIFNEAVRAVWRMRWSIRPGGG